MIYIDIDGVLADSDGYLKSIDPEALTDTHKLFKTIFKNYQTVFLKSKPLVDLSFLDKLDDYMLLTALPNKQNIASFTDDVDEVMSTLSKNKMAWVNEHIGDCKLAIVDSRMDKIKYCQSSNDVLIDDSTSTGKRWKEKGGKHYISVEQFLRNHDTTKTTPTLQSTQLW